MGFFCQSDLNACLLFFKIPEQELILFEFGYDKRDANLLFLSIYIFSQYSISKVMLIRLEQSFVETVSQLNANFSETEKQTLAANIESKYDNILSILKDKENNKGVKSKPEIIELGNIGSRSFSLSLYYSEDSEDDDIPLSVTQMLPTISPVRMDIMASLQQQQSNGNGLSYLKAGQVYDDGDVHSKYVDETIDEEDEDIQ